ncbi:hypothetical protein Tco_1338521 [Tanacetum coccineum]
MVRSPHILPETLMSFASGLNQSEQNRIRDLTKATNTTRHRLDLQADTMNGMMGTIHRMDTQMTWMQRDYRESRAESQNAWCFLSSLLILFLNYYDIRLRSSWFDLQPLGVIGVYGGLDGLENIFLRGMGDGIEVRRTKNFVRGRKAHLLEDKQIPSVGVFDEVFRTWMAFGGNTRDLGLFGEEADKTTTLHQIPLMKCSYSVWRRRRNSLATASQPSSNDVVSLTTVSGCGQPKETLEDLVSRD